MTAGLDLTSILFCLNALNPKSKRPCPTLQLGPVSTGSQEGLPVVHVAKRALKNKIGDRLEIAGDNMPENSRIFLCRS